MLLPGALQGSKVQGAAVQGWRGKEHNVLPLRFDVVEKSCEPCTFPTQ